MQVIEIIKLIASLIPTIIEIVKAVEASVPAKGAGAEKLSTVQTVLQTAYNLSAEAKPIPFDQLWVGMQKIINAFVTLFNSKGW